MRSVWLCRGGRGEVITQVDKSITQMWIIPFVPGVFWDRAAGSCPSVLPG